jgi:2'-5' RNA ligase
MRCFVALPLPDALRERIAALQVEAKKACRDVDVRWTAPASLHVTLKFLGEVGPDRVAELDHALVPCVAAHGAPRLALAGVGAFPSPARARVVWLGVTEGAAALIDLASAIDRALAPLGVAPESRPFTVHLTLGRVRAPRRGADLTTALAGLAGAAAGAWTPHAVVLYESHLRPDGAIHEARAEWPLGAERSPEMHRRTLETRRGPG